jgi:hypothetical protein
MISLFSRLIDYGVASQFRKDPSGRLVFIPSFLKGKCYFVDSKSDEEKLRGFVKMFRSPILLISWMIFPIFYVPALTLDIYAGLSPKSHRLAFALGIPLFFWLALTALIGMLWGVYQHTVPSVTASLTEVGPDVKAQLRALSRRPRALILVLLGASILLLGVAIAGAVRFHR